MNFQMSFSAKAGRTAELLDCGTAGRTRKWKNCRTCAEADHHHDGYKNPRADWHMQMQGVEVRTPESRIQAFVEPKTSCPGELYRLAGNVAKRYGVQVRGKEDYEEDEEQVVVVNMNTDGYPEFLKKLVTNGGRGVKTLFVEQYNHALPEHFQNVFEENVIDLSEDGELPPTIVRDELIPDLERKISKVLKRRNVEKTTEQVEQILKLQMNEKKPKKRVLTPARKFILKEKLSQYGTLEDVLKALQE